MPWKFRGQNFWEVEEEGNYINKIINAFWSDWQGLNGAVDPRILPQ